MMAKRTARQRNQLPTCYYEGYLEKRSFKDKTSRKLWACLCGNTLFFFNDKRDADYIEKVELTGPISITDDSSQDRNLDAARINLQMKDMNIKMTAPNAEARELWKGYIRSVAELSVPSSLNLLPGQIHMLKEAVEKEKERMKNLPPPPPPAVTNSSSYISVKADMPACYHNVSRLEAELLLEREAKRGNLLLRPGSNGNSFAVTTRQDLEGAVVRHYRVTRKPDGSFAIDVDNPVPCATLHDVINYLVDKTDRVLIPLILEEAYEKHISFIRSDNENGEKSVQQAPSSLVPPSVPPSVPPKPVSVRVPTPEPAPAPPEEESIYLNDKPDEEDKEAEDSLAAPLPPKEKKAPKKAIMPPTPAPRKMTSSPTPSFSTSSTSPSSPSMTKRDLRKRTLTDPLVQIPLAAITELKLKLELKAKSQE